MINIDHWSYASKLKNTDPLEKILFALLILSICLWANTILISVCVVMIMGGATVVKGGTPFRIFFKLMCLPMAFWVIGVATIAITTSSGNKNFLTAIHLGNVWLGITNLGLTTAVKLFFKALGAASCLYYLSLSTPLVDLLQALKRIKVPSLMIELMGLIYRFIFVFLETTDKIFTAQHARLGYSSLGASYRSLGNLAANLFIRAYKHSDELYTALESRGYDGELNVLHEPFKKQWSGHIFTFVITGILFALTLFLKRIDDSVN